MITTTIERNMKKNERKYMKWKKLLDFVIFNYYYYYYYCVYSHIVSGGKQEEIEYERLHLYLFIGEKFKTMAYNAWIGNSIGLVRLQQIEVVIPIFLY
jgi:hypothetical protein